MSESDEIELAAPCGEYCRLCPSYGGERTPRCEGCDAHKGHPSWGECRLHLCASKHNVEHCGLCTDFPCDFFVGRFDPENPAGQRNAIVRTGLLAYRRKHGNKKWLDLANKLGQWKKIP